MVHGIFTTSKNTTAVNLTVILNFIGVKMTMNCDYDSSVVGVILPVEKEILPIVQLIDIEIDRTTHTFFTLFAKNTVAVFLIVVKMAAPHRPLQLDRRTYLGTFRTETYKSPLIAL